MGRTNNRSRRFNLFRDVPDSSGRPQREQEPVRGAHSLVADPGHNLRDRDGISEEDWERLDSGSGGLGPDDRYGDSDYLVAQLTTWQLRKQYELLHRNRRINGYGDALQRMGYYLAESETDYRVDRR